MDLAFEELKTENGTVTQTESKSQKLECDKLSASPKNKQTNPKLFALKKKKYRYSEYQATSLMNQSGGKMILKASVFEYKPN